MNMIRFAILLVLSSFILASCGGESITTKNEFCCISGMPVDLRDNSVDINGFINTSVIQITQSDDKSNQLVSSIDPERGIARVDLINRQKKEQIYNGIGLPFAMSINSNGDWLLFLYTNSSSDTEVLSSLETLNLPPKQYTTSAASNSYFVTGNLQTYDETYRLTIVDILSNQSVEIATHTLADEMSINDLPTGATITLSGIDSISGKQKNEIYEVIDSSPPIANLKESIFLPKEEEASPFNNAIEYISSNDPLGNAACAHNFTGRLSWYASYRLEAILRGRHQLRGIGYPIDWVINNMVDCLLQRYSEDLASQNIGWITKKYSIDKSTDLTLLVNNATVLYSLLLASNTGLISKEKRLEIARIGNTLFEYHEPQWDGANNTYRIRKNVNYVLDGVLMPWNWQTVWASALIELHKLTLDYRYLYRAEAIASSFKAEWVYLDDYVLWHYWPGAYFDGWDTSDGVSLNTPILPASTNARFEDNSHAGLNVQFVLHYFYSDNTGQVFDSFDIERLKVTLENMRYGSSWSRFISGDITYQPASVLHMPWYGWPELNNLELAKMISEGIPTKTSFFDQSKALTYLIVNQPKRLQ